MSLGSFRRFVGPTTRSLTASWATPRRYGSTSATSWHRQLVAPLGHHPRHSRDWPSALAAATEGQGGHRTPQPRTRWPLLCRTPRGVMRPAPLPPRPSLRLTASPLVAAGLREQMDAPFTVEFGGLLDARRCASSVVGPITPWLAKRTKARFCRLMTAEANAWRRGRLPAGDARVATAPVPKPRKVVKTPADLRGIVVGSLPAKLYAGALEQRVTQHAEAAGLHADGQFGFRQHRNTEQAALALGVAAESYRHRHRRWRADAAKGGSPSCGHALWTSARPMIGSPGPPLGATAADGLRRRVVAGCPGLVR